MTEFEEEIENEGLSQEDIEPEVCVWILNGPMWYTSCGMGQSDALTSMKDKFKPCQFCGKKKEVKP